MVCTISVSLSQPPQHVSSQPLLCLALTFSAAALRDFTSLVPSQPLLCLALTFTVAALRDFTSLAVPQH